LKGDSLLTIVTDPELKSNLFTYLGVLGVVCKVAALFNKCGFAAVSNPKSFPLVK
jgi:hypothetical protein